MVLGNHLLEIESTEGMARHSNSGRKYLHNLSPTVTTTNGHQRFVAKMRHARYVANEDTWQRYVEVGTHRH